MNKHGIKICPICANEFRAPRARSKYCSKLCLLKSRHGETAPHWKGGRRIKKDGYVDIWVEHKTTVPEHTLIAEKALGRMLPSGSVVHHWDENPTNNTSSNLVICQDHAYHMLLHARKRRIEDTGSLVLKRCSVCREVLPLDAFNSGKGNSFDDKSSACKECSREAALRYYYAAREEGKQWALRHK